jgi:hypothetical protein
MFHPLFCIGHRSGSVRVRVRAFKNTQGERTGRRRADKETRRRAGTDQDKWEGIGIGIGIGDHVMECRFELRENNNDTKAKEGQDAIHPSSILSTQIIYY